MSRWLLKRASLGTCYCFFEWEPACPHDEDCPQLTAPHPSAVKVPRAELDTTGGIYWAIDLNSLDDLQSLAPRIVMDCSKAIGEYAGLITIYDTYIE